MRTLAYPEGIFPIIIKNLFDKPCEYCGEIVFQQTGFAVKIDEDERWFTAHVNCYNEHNSAR